jgi:predicted nucleic acid-binding protein
MKVLLDTCVLAELRHHQATPAVKSAVTVIADEDLYISVLIVGEIARAVASVSDIRKKRALNSWLTVLQRQFADRILPVDSEVAYLWGDISARARATGLILPAVDGLLAATALRHGLYVMTRLPTPIAAAGALTIDPWKET